MVRASPRGGAGVLKVDGADVATLKVARTIPFLLPADETFDIGTDTRTGVNDKDYQPPLNFNGKIDKVTFSLGKIESTEVEQRMMREALARAKD
jgi:hypothetical protein